MDTKCWIKKNSKTNDDRPYYQNLESGISQWGIPTNDLLPAGWEMHKSITTSKNYYGHSRQNITQWNKPNKGDEPPKGWKQKRTKNCNNIYYENIKSGLTQWQYPINVFRYLLPIIQYFGVLGVRKGSTEKPSIKKSYAIVDPAGLNHIEGNPNGAGGLSRAIYDFVGIKDSFPKDVQNSIKKTGDAKYHKYGEYNVIHAVGPDFSKLYTKIDDRIFDEAVGMLVKTYLNIISEAEKTSKDIETILLCVISGGIFSGVFGDKKLIQKITVRALYKAFSDYYMKYGYLKKVYWLCTYSDNKEEYQKFKHEYDEIDK